MLCFHYNLKIFYIMLKFIKEVQSLQGTTLFVSALSAGLVPTYALDSLITRNQFQRIAFFHSDYLEPSVGYLPKNIEEGALGLPGEIYRNGDVIILQLRSLVKFGRKNDFAKEVASFVNKNKIGEVIVLGSLPYSIKPDREITSLQKNIYFKAKGNISEKLKLKRCAQLNIIHPFEQLKDPEQQEEVILDHAGLCKALHKQLPNLVLLLIFNEKEEDKQTGVYFSKQLYKIVDKKEISRVN